MSKKDHFLSQYSLIESFKMIPNGETNDENDNIEPFKNLSNDTPTISPVKELVQDYFEMQFSEEEDDDEKEEMLKEIDEFEEHYFKNFESNEIEKLKSCRKISHKHQWPNIGTFIETCCEESCFNNSKLSYSKETQMKSRLMKHERFDSFQTELLSLLNSYKNLYYPKRQFDNSERIRMVYTAHALNHIIKTRNKIIKNNIKIKENPDHKQTDQFRDQGLTRPKVLIVLPFRDSALRTINCMIKLLYGEETKNVMNYKRFIKEFSIDEEDSLQRKRKPIDYQQTFNGNIDDMFRIGLALTKNSLKLYTEFYSSDIIIASPLGLHLTGEDDEKKETNFDFLSSIESIIIDQADIFLMQNWTHMINLMSNINSKPKETHGVDFSRVKNWVLELWSRYYCQLIMFSSTTNSLLIGFFNHNSLNYSGKILFQNETDPNGSTAINGVYIQCPQIFHRFSCDAFEQRCDIRFDFFIKKILPNFRNPLFTRSMIYVPSYLDFVRLRNYFRDQEIDFFSICEYTKPGKVAQIRHKFFNASRHFLLYTERYHFYNRSIIKGIRHLIFYEPPLYAHFYSELVNSMNQSNQGRKLFTDYSSMSVTVLYNRFDFHSLIDLLGTEKSRTLCADQSSETEIHRFCIDIDSNCSTIKSN